MWLWHCVSLCVFVPACFSPLFVAVGSLGKETNTGIQSACNTRYPGSGEWRVDVAVMEESRAYCVPLCTLSPDTHTHSALVSGSGVRHWPLASDLVNGVVCQLSAQTKTSGLTTIWEIFLKKTELLILKSFSLYEDRFYFNEFSSLFRYLLTVLWLFYSNNVWKPWKMIHDNVKHEASFLTVLISG